MEHPVEEIRVIDVAGTPREIGEQHGRAVRDLRARIAAAAARQVAEVPLPVAEATARRSELRAVLGQASPGTLEQIAGLAAGLDLDAGLLFDAVTAGYLHDLALAAGREAAAEGCTTWAAAGAATRAGQPLLVKNRDFRLDHLELQIVLRARPQGGIPWCAVTSAGAPGVYSSGMNAAGLALVDTHVSARDAGPGLPRYSMMLHALEAHETVASALDFFASVPSMGLGNLVLADAGGAVATVECAHSGNAVVRRQGGTLVATNHFVSDRLAPSYVAGSPAGEASSRGRHAAVSAALAVAHGRIDSAFARDLMARHDGPQRSLCRHRTQDSTSETISCAIFHPASRTMEICQGLPCEGRYRAVRVEG